MHFSVLDNRVIKLRNLKSHRQIRIEIVFPIKRAKRLNIGIDSVSKKDCLIYDFLTEKRKCSRLSGADGTDVGVGRSVEVLLVFTATEDFSLAVELEVDFKSDSDEVVGHFRLKKLKAKNG
jgi:hypothetical protein